MTDSESFSSEDVEYQIEVSKIDSEELSFITKGYRYIKKGMNFVSRLNILK